MKVWFEIPTKAGLVKIEVPELPACVGSDRSAEVRLRHPSVAAFHALIHASAEGVGISAILPSNQLIYDGNDCRSIPLDDGDRIKIGEVPVLVRIEEDETEDEDQDEADVLTLDDTDEHSTAVSDVDDNEFEDEDCEDDCEDDEEFGEAARDVEDADSEDSEQENEAEEKDLAQPSQVSGWRSSKPINLARLAPDEFEREFLDGAGQFQEWLTPFERETIVSQYLIHRLCDWRLRGLVEPEGEVSIPTQFGDTNAIPPPSRTLLGTQKAEMDGQHCWYICLECGAIRGDAVHTLVCACNDEISIPLPKSARVRLNRASKYQVFSIGACGRCAAMATASLRPPANLTARMPFAIVTTDMASLAEKCVDDVSPGSKMLNSPFVGLNGGSKRFQPAGYRQSINVHPGFEDITGWSASQAISEQTSWGIEFRDQADEFVIQIKLRAKRLERNGRAKKGALDHETGATLQRTLAVGSRLFSAFAATLKQRESDDGEDAPDDAFE